MLSFTDQTGQLIRLRETPQRIISLVPSITEYLADIGLEKNLVGITKFCIRPDHIYRNVERVGGTKDFSVEKIIRLKADLILANKEENDRARIEELRMKVPVWVSVVENTSQAVDMMEEIAKITGRSTVAESIIRQTRQGFESLRNATKGAAVRVLYLIWRKPYMAAGTDTYISDVLRTVGWYNVLYEWGTKGKRYPELSLDQITSLKPDVLLLSSEPYPFRDMHLTELLNDTGIKCMLVDGEAFSWYGSRMLKSLPYLSRLKGDFSN